MDFVLRFGRIREISTDECNTREIEALFYVLNRFFNISDKMDVGFPVRKQDTVEVSIKTNNTTFTATLKNSGIVKIVYKDPDGIGFTPEFLGHLKLKGVTVFNIDDGKDVKIRDVQELISETSGIRRGELIHGLKQILG